MIAAVVPAAGRSIRMGEPKLLLRSQGESLIGRVVIALRRGGADRVIVVAPPSDSDRGPDVAAEAREAGAEVLVPTARPAEMRDSIELGLTALARGSPPRSVLLTPGDTPGITAEIVAQVLESAFKWPDWIVVPTCEGRRGHPIALPWSLAVVVPTLPDGVGVNELVHRYRDRLVELPVESRGITADMDTPDDLRRWNAQWPDDALRGKACPRPAEAGPTRPLEKIVVRVRLFALARERAGCSEIDLELPHRSTVAGVRATLAERLPALAALLPSVLIAVNEQYAGDDSLLPPDARIAVIPPVSGGAGDPDDDRLETAWPDRREPRR
jgi:molybdenum cofactor cytidylyltransferase